MGDLQQDLLPLRTRKPKWRSTSQKHYFCTGGEASLFSSCCTTSCIVCRSSSSRRFCSACPSGFSFFCSSGADRLLLFLSVCLLQEMAAHSPLLWEDQRKISQLKSDFSIIDIYRLKNWTCFRHAFLNLLNQWNL